MILPNKKKNKIKFGSIENLVIFVLSLSNSEGCASQADRVDSNLHAIFLGYK